MATSTSGGKIETLLGAKAESLLGFKNRSEEHTSELQSLV